MRILLSLSLLTLAACTKAPPAVTAPPLRVPQLETAAKPSTEALLVWTTDGDAEPTTTFVDAEGHALGSTPGVLLASGGDVWRLRSETTTRNLSACNGPGVFDSESTTMSISLEPLTPHRAGSRRLFGTYFDRPKGEHDGEGPTDAGEVIHSFAASGSVGPYLFLREPLFIFACGAHGFHSMEQHVIDIRTGQPVKLEETRPEEHARAATKAKALFVQKSQETPGVGALWNGEAPSEIAWLAVEPRIGRGAEEIELVGILGADAPYVFGSSAWRAYMIDAEVPLTTIPRELQAHARIPAAVRRFSLAIGDARIGGFSTIDGERANELMRALPAAPLRKREP